MILRIGDEAPDFEADSTQGSISFHDYLGDGWGVLFSHPEDFTPVCTTELAQVARLEREWERRGVKTVAYSVDSLDSHSKWVGDIERYGYCKVNYPILDGSDRKVAVLYGMLDSSSGEERPKTVRSVFIIDPKKKIRLILTYPTSTGRNFAEVIRCIDSLKLFDSKNVVTAADWKKGQPAIIPPSVSEEEAADLYPEKQEHLPYLRFTRKTREVTENK